MSHKLALLCCLSIVFFSCKPSKKFTFKDNNNGNQPIRIPVNKSDSLLFLTEKAIDFKITNLDSNQLVAEVSKVLHISNNIFVLDTRANKLFCYNEDGRLKWQYNKFGKGPEEHDRLNDVSFRGNNIYLFDKKNKIIQIDTNGNFISAKRLDIRQPFVFPENLFVDEFKNYLFYNNDLGDPNEIDYSFALVDSGLTKIKSGFIKKTHANGDAGWLASSFPLQPFIDNSGFFYAQPLNDTIYAYQKGKFKRDYIVDFGEYKPSESFVNKPFTTLNEFWTSGFGSNICDIYSTKAFLTFKTTIDGQPYHHFINHKTGQVMDFGGMAIEAGEFEYMFKFIGGKSDNSLYFVLEPDVLVRTYKSVKSLYFGKLSDTEFKAIVKKKYPLVDKLMTNLTIYSNPILINVTLKAEDVFK